MGEYWKPVNVTRKEWIHPHSMNDGLKWGEWTGAHGNTLKLMRERWSPTDEMYAVSDYGGLRKLVDLNVLEAPEGEHGWPGPKSINVPTNYGEQWPDHVPTYDALDYDCDADESSWGTRIKGTDAEWEARYAPKD